jgi:hypothetical protein
MLAEMVTYTEQVQRTCPSCHGAVGERADWCGQCYSRLRITVPSSEVQRHVAMNPRLGNMTPRPAGPRWRRSLDHVRDLGVRIAITLGVAYGVAWSSFNLKPQWYAASLAGAAYVVWSTWRSNRHYA